MSLMVRPLVPSDIKVAQNMAPKTSTRQLTFITPPFAAPPLSQPLVTEDLRFLNGKDKPIARRYSTTYRPPLSHPTTAAQAPHEQYPKLSAERVDRLPHCPTAAVAVAASPLTVAKATVLDCCCTGGDLSTSTSSRCRSWSCTRSSRDFFGFATPDRTTLAAQLGRSAPIPCGPVEGQRRSAVWIESAMTTCPARCEYPYADLPQSVLPPTPSLRWPHATVGCSFGDMATSRLAAAPALADSRRWKVTVVSVWEIAARQLGCQRQWSPDWDQDADIE